MARLGLLVEVPEGLEFLLEGVCFLVCFGLFLLGLFKLSFYVLDQGISRCLIHAFF